MALLWGVKTNPSWWLTFHIGNNEKKISFPYCFRISPAFFLSLVVYLHLFFKESYLLIWPERGIWTYAYNFDRKVWLSKHPSHKPLPMFSLFVIFIFMLLCKASICQKNTQRPKAVQDVLLHVTERVI